MSSASRVAQASPPRARELGEFDEELRRVARRHSSAIRDHVANWRGKLASAGVPRSEDPGRLPWNPAVLTRSQLAKARQAQWLVVMGINQLVARRFNGDLSALGAALQRSGADRALADLEAAHPQWRPLVARPDLAITAAGKVSVFEPNLTAAVGGLSDHDLLVDLFTSAPGIAPLLARRRLTATNGAAHLAQLFGRMGAAGAVVALTDWSAALADGGAMVVHLNALSYVLRRAGVRVLSLPVEALRIVPGWGVFTEDGERVSIVYRFFEPPAASDARRALFDELVGAVRTGLVALLDGLRGHVFHSKLMLAFLSDPRTASALSPALRDALARVLPWTRAVADTRTVVGSREVGLLDYLEDARERLVLKPADGYGGRDVTFGCEVEPPVWRGLLERAVAGEELWIAQEAESTEGYAVLVDEGDDVRWHDVRADWGIYFVDGRVAAAVRRTTLPGVPGRLIKRGGMVPVFSASA